MPAKEDDDHDRDNIIIDSPELEFWDRIPTVWDDTKIIAGEIGEYAIVARRSGKDWFVGAINDDTLRTLKLPLDFLADGGNYTASIYSDDLTIETMTRVGIERRTVTRGDVLDLELLEHGGAAIWIAPK